MTRLLTALALSTLIAAPAYAQGICTGRNPVPYSTIENGLRAKFNEGMVFRGVKQNGAYGVVLFLAESGTWTVVLMQPDGMACVVEDGIGGEVVAMAGGEPA